MKTNTKEIETVNNSEITERLTFLAKTFDVFELKKGNIELKVKTLSEQGYDVTIINGSDKKIILGLLSIKKGDTEKVHKKISISLDVFTSMIEADPTDNKMYLQWMLNLFSRYLKNEEHIEEAIRFVEEDLPQAKQYLIIYEGNKRKQKFKKLGESSYVLKGIKDVTDISQYKSLGQLFDAIDPFIERKQSGIEGLLQRFVDAGEAEIPVKDRKFTVYIPKTRDASVVFDKYASWCTAKPGNGNFKSYTENPKPNGHNSNLYIIIDNKFFKGESNEIYQIHFESNQIKDRSNSDISIFETVINESEGVANFFYNELMTMAKENKKGMDDNKYLDYLIKFGFTESLFDFLDVSTPTIRLMTREIPKLPDVSRFRELDTLVITDAKLVELHPSIGQLSNLDMLSLSGNKIKKIPKEIGNLKKLNFINLKGNKIVDIPDEIKYLDKSNGGNLARLVITIADIGENNYKKLKNLLPSTTVTE